MVEYPPALPTRHHMAAMGVKDLQAVNNQGRPFSLLEEGEPILPLFA